MKRAIYERQAERALVYFSKAGIILSDEEKKKIEVVDHSQARSSPNFPR